ncbi:hypothetical protein NXS19_004110 [Fusarium pseudograminearum]|nr:hypothetical protein NXS19_004110 [Fusarium pseudograminearum]
MRLQQEKRWPTPQKLGFSPLPAFVDDLVIQGCSPALEGIFTCPNRTGQQKRAQEKKMRLPLMPFLSPYAPIVALSGRSQNQSTDCPNP